ncbi:MAG: hypothetical protein ACKOVI_02750 [Candidatus Planktophila sp.]
MRREWSVKASIFALVVSLFALSPISAYGDSTSTPTPDASRSAFEQYRIDREIYLAAVKERNAIIRNINITFKSACDKAASDFKSAMSVARTPDQKNAAITARKNAISAAIVVRDDSISALGAEPVPPVEPMKPFKASSKNKSR